MGCEEFEQIVDFEEPNPVDVEEPSPVDFEGPSPFDRIRRAATAPLILFFTSVMFANILKFTFPLGCRCMQCAVITNTAMYFCELLGQKCTNHW